MAQASGSATRTRRANPSTNNTPKQKAPKKPAPAKAQTSDTPEVVYKVLRDFSGNFTRVAELQGAQVVVVEAGNHRLFVEGDHVPESELMIGGELSALVENAIDQGLLERIVKGTSRHVEAPPQGAPTDQTPPSSETLPTQ